MVVMDEISEACSGTSEILVWRMFFLRSSRRRVAICGRQKAITSFHDLYYSEKRSCRG